MAETALTRSAGGVLLAGGQSRRFGAEKAVARFGDGAMMDAVLARFTRLAHCAVSARAGSAAEAHARARGIPVLHDAINAPSGPLAGVSSGLVWARALCLEVVATAPCDTPLLPRGLFADLLNALADAPAAYAVTSAGAHPLCAVWRVDAATHIAAAIVGGRHPPVRALLANIGARPVHFEDAAAFANANTRAALDALGRAA